MYPAITHHLGSFSALHQLLTKTEVKFCLLTDIAFQHSCFNQDVVVSDSILKYDEKVGAVRASLMLILRIQ